MERSLVIVESPAKAKTIEKYLGKGFHVRASMGHLRDLPKKTLSVDIEGGFIPDYQPIPNREDLIRELRTESEKADRIYLATDPDREGEAISWHLKELLDLPDGKTVRVTFNEITKKVVLESIESPREIDMNLVDAQQARRVLDRIVGYKLSPMLWQKIRRGLSAGRVQSVATRLVVDREEEIRKFVPKESWLVDAVLSAESSNESFKARYTGSNGRKRELKNAEEADQIEREVRNAPFSVSDVKRTDKRRSPAAPFITSTLQQEASRRLNMTPRRTMAVAQNLYEGLPVLGRESAGLITYMRTDSLRISEEAAAAAKEYIRAEYGADYYPGKARTFKVGKNAQDAHEAIRPSDVSLTPESIRGDLTSEQYRLYRLIWRRFIASQMSDAVYDSVTLDAVSAGHTFRATASALKFPGFTKVYDTAEEEKSTRLPILENGAPLRLLDIHKEQKFSQPPARYTEDTLIRALEEKGIGRPSTYAPTVSTIIDREYVVKEGKSLRPTNLGETVTTFMEAHFPDIVDVQFTARMEAGLDRVEEGETPWKELLSDFYGGFRDSLSKAETDLQGVRIRVPDEISDEVCPECGKNLVYKSGRFGRFLGCPGFPECTFTKPIEIEMPGSCPKCGSRLLKRTSRRGFPYYGCEKKADCGFMTWDVPLKDTCPECGHTMFRRSGRGRAKGFCINEACPAFVPEDKRGYYKKATGTPENGEPPESTAPAAKETEPVAGQKKETTKAATAKKTPAKKAPAKKTATAKGTAKKTASKSAAKSAGKTSTSKTKKTSGGET